MLFLLPRLSVQLTTKPTQYLYLDKTFAVTCFFSYILLMNREKIFSPYSKHNLALKRIWKNLISLGGLFVKQGFILQIKSISTNWAKYVISRTNTVWEYCNGINLLKGEYISNRCR